MKNVLVLFALLLLAVELLCAQSSVQYLSNKDNFCLSSGTFQGNWELVGPKSYFTQNMGRIDPVWVDPDDENHVFAGSLSGGLFEKTSTGDWICKTNNLPGVGVHDIDVYKNAWQSTIVISTNTDDKRYSYGHGIYYSNDGGNTWVFDEEYIEIAGVQLANVGRTRFMHNTDGLISYCNHKVLKKESLSDPNSHWTDITPSSMGADIDLFDIEMSPTDKNVFWVAGNNGSSGTGIGLFYTVDGGNSFTALTSTLNNPTFINVSIPANEDAFVYYYTGTTAYINHYHLNTMTNQYDLQPNPTHPGQHGIWFAVSPIDFNDMYFGTSATSAFFNSTNGGSAISSGISTLHSDVRYILVYSNGDVFVGDDGGVSKSSNKGNLGTWTNLNATGLNVTEFWGMSGVEEQPGVLFGGTQDNQNWRFDDGVPTIFLTGLDGYGTESYLNSNGEIVLFYQKGPGIGGPSSSDVYKRTEPTGSSTSINPSISGKEEYSKPLHKQPGGKFYLGMDDLYISLNDDPNNGADYQAQGLKDVLHNNLADAVSAFDVSNMDDDRIYVAYNGAGDYGGSTHFMNQLFYNDPVESWDNRTPGHPVICTACSSCNAYPTCFNAISGVVSDPEDYERVWICFRGFDYDADGTLSNEKLNGVMFSEDAGITWHHINTGLPNFPVNCIEYQNGTDDILYVGTDAGVFTWVHTPGQDAWVGEWKCFSSGLPACMVRDIEINYCAQKIRLATLGRGIWESDLFPQTLVIPAIQNTFTWSSNQKVIRSIEILAGQTLTINNGAVINMCANTFIKVDKGGKLIIDGATLTNSCGYLWSGIQVIGDPLQDQSYNTGTGYYNYQGWLVMKNGATIENAYVAAMADEASYTAPDYTYPNGTVKGGGIIQAENASFINCRKAIGFGSYHAPPIGNNIEPVNKSFVKHCTFDCNGFLNPPYQTSYTSEFISAWNVHRVQMQGNIFNGPVAVNPSLSQVQGVVGVDADLIVEDYCDPSQNPCTHTTFNNIYRGVKSTITNPAIATKYFGVTNCVFNNTTRGVYLAGHQNASVLFNHFTLNETTDTTYAIYTSACTFYTVEENTVTGLAIPNPISYGIIVNSSVSNANANDDNLVYKNWLTNLQYGTVSLKRNANTASGSGPFHGLVFRCNSYTNVKYSIAVFPACIVCQNVPTIKMRQGSSTSPVGNSFISVPIGGYSLWKLTNPNVVYFHHNNAPYIPPANINNFIPLSTGIAGNENSCPTHFPGQGGQKLAEYSPSEAKDLINTYEETVASLFATIDGGNTAGLMADAANPNISSTDLKTTLLAVGPYVSDTVLNAALVRDQPMTTGDAKAVILNNSPVTDTIYSVLEEEKPAVANNVVVINAQEGSSARNDLESEIGSINLQRYLEIRDLRNYYEDNDSVENMYDYAKEKEMNLLSTPYAMATNDWDGAQELINQLLSATEEDYNLKTYFQFALDKNAAGESVYELSADESATVSATKNEETYSGILAANLDAFVNDDWYFEELPVIDETQMRTAAVKDYSEIEIPQLYPNPATYEVFIVITSGTEEENIFIVVSDLFGKELKHIPVISKSTEVSINVSDLSAGIYHCVIQSSNQIFRNSKLVVLH